ATSSPRPRIAPGLRPPALTQDAPPGSACPAPLGRPRAQRRLAPSAEPGAVCAMAPAVTTTTGGASHDPGKARAAGPARHWGRREEPHTIKGTREHQARPATGDGCELHEQDSATALTTNASVVIADNQNSLKAGPRGPTLREDFIMREKITHFDHQRIPERIV